VTPCATFEPLLAESLLGHPGDADLERHLAGCDSCAERRLALGATLARVRAARPAVPAQPDLAAAIVAAAFARKAPPRPARSLVPAAILGVAVLGAGLGLLELRATPPRATPILETPREPARVEKAGPSDEALVRTLDPAGEARPAARLQDATRDELDAVAGAGARGLLEAARQDDALEALDPEAPADEVAALEGAALERAIARLPRAQ
jgi:hypothetical protein